MSEFLVTKVLAVNLVCAALYGALVAVVAARWGLQRSALLLLGACAATALWALNGAFASAGGSWELLLRVGLEVLRSISWILVLSGAYSDGLSKPASRREVGRLQLAAVAFALALIALEMVVGGLGSRRTQGLWFDLAIYGHLIITSSGLVLLELLLYRSSPETRSRFMYFWLGIGVLLLYDLVLYSEALLFGRLRQTLWAGHGAVAALATPMLGIAPIRHATWLIDFHVERRAVFRSIALLGVAIYLLGIAAAGTLMRVFGISP
jgi:hypothetical protein